MYNLHFWFVDDRPSTRAPAGSLALSLSPSFLFSSSSLLLLPLLLLSTTPVTEVPSG